MDRIAPGPVPAPSPAAGGQPVAAALPAAFAPGQVVSARVMQALGAGTWLVAARGQALVAESPTPLTLDTVVRLVVQGGGNGDPLRVRLSADGAVGVPGTAADLVADPASDALRQMARQLGLPAGDAATLVLAAFQREGAPLAGPALQQAVRLVVAGQPAPEADPGIPVDAGLETPDAPPAAADPGSFRDSRTDARQTAAKTAVTVAPPATADEQPGASTAGARTTVAAPPRSAASGVPLPSSPISHAESNAREPDAHPTAIAAHPAPAAAPARGDASAPRAPGGPLPPTSRPASASPAAVEHPPSGRPAGSPPATPIRDLTTTARLASALRALPAGDPPGLLRTAAGLPAAQVAEAAARLARSPLPVTAATLPLAVIATRADLPRLAERLPTRAGGGPAASADALPVRGQVDLAARSPAEAIVTALRLAGVVPSGGEPVDSASLVHQLIRLAVTLAPRPATGGGSATAGAVAQPEGDAPAQHQPVPAPASVLPHVVGDQAVDRRPAAEGAAPVPGAPATAAEATAAVREAVAQDLLPPKELADYDRVVALPLAIQGQPLPARLAVTTRRTPTGGTACWMRVDCELSRLGTVSVRLSGADGGPLAITLAGNARAGALLADGLPDLVADLRGAGLDAAVRVVVDGDLP